MESPCWVMATADYIENQVLAISAFELLHWWETTFSHAALSNW